MWTNKHTIFQGDPFPNHVSIFDGYVAPNSHTGFNEAMISDIAIHADGDALHYVDKGPNASALADLLSFYDRSWMYEYVVHTGFTLA
jgi:hypothetical protein